LVGRPTIHRKAHEMEMSEFRRASPIYAVERFARVASLCGDRPEPCLPGTTEVVGSI
jgi:hypothetical protein